MLRSGEPAEAQIEALAGLVDGADSPALVVGAGAADEDSWDALVLLAERLACPVWQESFGARAGFPQDHPRFAGHLPADRPRLRDTLSGHDLVLAVGAPVFRQYPFAEGPFVDGGTTVALVTGDAAEAHRAPVALSVLADPAGACRALAARIRPRTDEGTSRTAPPPPGPDGALRAGHVLALLGDHLPADAALVEETPSSRPELHARVPARNPLGFVSAAMGGLGFALPAAVGMRMADPARPVVAVLGDGSALYQVQALWSAARYSAGVLVIVLANGRYAIMDRLAERTGADGPWPDFAEVELAAVARGLGCAAERIDDRETLASRLPELLAGLADRTDPLLLEVAVEPDPDFNP